MFSQRVYLAVFLFTALVLSVYLLDLEDEENTIPYPIYTAVTFDHGFLDLTKNQTFKKSEDTLIELEDTFIKSKDTLIQSDNNLIQSKDTVIKSEDTVIKSEDTFIKSEDTKKYKSSTASYESSTSLKPTTHAITFPESSKNQLLSIFKINHGDGFY